MSLLFLFVAIGLSFFISFLSYFKPPEWAEEWGAKAKWLKLSIGSWLLAAMAAIAAYVGLGDASTTFRSLAPVLIGLLTVATFQSTFTDTKSRLVDRRVLNLASLMSAIFAGFIYWDSRDWITASITISMVVFAAFCYLVFISSMGASDVRALALVGVAAVPVLGWSGFMWASLAAGASFMIIGLSVAFITRSTKNSFPGVPMLLIPYWIFTLLACFITFSTNFMAVGSSI